LVEHPLGKGEVSGSNPDGGFSQSERTMPNVKQVILYRKDLNMRKGKIAAQVAHASLKVFFDRRLEEDSQIMKVPLNPAMQEWVCGSFAKIVLSVADEEDLLEAYRLANEAGLPVALIKDSGHTEFKAPCPECDGDPTCKTCEGVGRINVPTHTTVAIGPAPSEAIDLITGPSGLVKTKLV
jgi:PTH2 family peptidyl-tRNA hydrolase